MLRQVLGLSLLAVVSCRGEGPAPAAPAPAADARPAKRATEAFEVSLAVPRPAEGGKAELVIEIAARGAFHVSTDYPTHFLAAEPPVFGGPRVDLTDATREPCKGAPGEVCRLRAAIPFAATGARVGGVVAFSVCDPEACLIEKAELATDVGAR